MWPLSFEDEVMWVAGVDEAGRGCVAGPVVAAAVILPPESEKIRVADSKRLTPQQRARSFDELVSAGAMIGIALEPPEVIDRINILQASIRAMHQALQRLPVRPSKILVDGPYFLPFGHIPHQCIVRGDASVSAISAASIIAKVWRDRLMERLHYQFPHYQWLRNKGYPTSAHIEAIRRHGPSPYHRQSFRIKALTPSLFPENDPTS